MRWFIAYYKKEKDKNTPSARIFAKDIEEARKKAIKLIPDATLRDIRKVENVKGNRYDNF